jgi:hypothetical protein
MSNHLVQDNYFYNEFESDSQHSEWINMNGGSGGLLIKHNTFVTTLDEEAPFAPAVYMTNDSGTPGNIVIDDNFIGGKANGSGHFPIFIGMTGGYAGIFRLTNNHFDISNGQNPPGDGSQTLGTSTGALPSGSVISGNTLDNNGVLTPFTPH